MNERDWQNLVLSKVEKIEEGQDALIQMFYTRSLENEKEISKINQDHISLKEKVHVLWGAIILVASTILTAFIGKKL